MFGFGSLQVTTRGRWGTWSPWKFRKNPNFFTKNCRFYAWPPKKNKVHIVAPPWKMFWFCPWAPPIIGAWSKHQIQTPNVLALLFSVDNVLLTKQKINIIHEMNCAFHIFPIKFHIFPIKR